MEIPAPAGNPGVASGLGGDLRFYRTVMLERGPGGLCEDGYGQGLSEEMILFKHVLKNAMIPVLTATVLSLPFLDPGSLLLRCISAYRAWGT